MQTGAWISHVAKALAVVITGLIAVAGVKWGFVLTLSEDQIAGLLIALFGALTGAVFQLKNGPKPMPASDAAKAAEAAAKVAKVASEEAATKAAASEAAAAVATDVAKVEKSAAVAAAKTAKTKGK